MATTNDCAPTSLDFEFKRLQLSRSGAARSSSASIAPKTADVPRPAIITLDVAGRLFKISTDILIAESGLFQKQLSGRYNWTPQHDGTYFLDVDPDLFEHLIRFMRRPSVFPLFWTKSQGFDYGLYQRLQAEAEYFQMDALHDWIKNRGYLQAVETCIDQPAVEELAHFVPRVVTGDAYEDCQYVTKVRKTYICPRGIPVHYGKRDACGRACHKHQGDNATEYDEEYYVEVIRERRHFLFNAEACQNH